MATVNTGLVEAAKKLGPLLRENADQGERDRRLAPATVKGLTEAGLFRLGRPRELGGLEADPLTVLHVCEELGRHDGSAAWCALNCSIASVLQSFLSREGTREIGNAPDVVVNGVFAPSGRAIEVDGGYRVSGRWAFVSNCEYCHWVALGCIVFKGDQMSMTPMGPEIIVSWIKTSDCRIIDTWDAVGLRATGSNDVEVADLFVPKHRTSSVPMITPVADGALFRFPLVGLFAVGIAASALGLAQAAIDEVLRLAASKTPFGMMSTLANRATAQLAVVEALAQARSARALLVEETARVWGTIQAGAKEVPAKERGLLRMATTHATQTAASVIDRMYTTAGGTAVYSSSPLQRHLRDVRGMTQHFFVAPHTYEMIGKVLLGVEPDGFML